MFSHVLARVWTIRGVDSHRQISSEDGTVEGDDPSKNILFIYLIFLPLGRVEPDDVDRLHLGHAAGNAGVCEL